MAVGAPTYRLYVDEVGNASADDLGDNGRYLSLSGAIIKQGEDWRNLRDSLEELKTKHFPAHSKSNPIVLHRQKMVAARPPFRCMYRESKRIRVWSDVLAIIEKTPFTVVTTGIDKKPHVERHGANAWDPYDYCLLALIQRYVMFLGARCETGDVMVESRTPSSDRRLAAAFRRIYARGCGKIGKEIYWQRLSSSALKIKSKRNNDPGLQLVDLIASPSDKMIRAKCGGVTIERSKHLDLDREIVKILSGGKYRTSPQGQVVGWGLVWIR